MHFFFYKTDNSLEYLPFDDEFGLPFPLNLSKMYKNFISIFLIISLLYGLRLRLKIISYLQAPETKFGPIDYLIWMDQLNGLCLAFVIVSRLVAINSSAPLGQILGDNFCYWIDLPSCIYIVGAVVWSSLIALYRLILVTSQQWMTSAIGDKKFLMILIVTGISSTTVVSILLPMFDSKNTTERMCYHYSIEDCKIIFHIRYVFSSPDAKINFNFNLEW